MLQSYGFRSLPDIRAVARMGLSGMPEVLRTQPENSDVSTRDTVQKMCELIDESRRDPLFNAVAQRALEQYSRGRNDPDACAWAAWQLAHQNIAFVQDDPQAAKYFSWPQALELLISPAAMIRSQIWEGDCDDFTMMELASLSCYGVPWRIKTVCANRKQPSIWSHVYGLAVLPGSYLPMDASHGDHCGWEVPARDIFRSQLWDEQGTPVFEGDLHQ